METLSIVYLRQNSHEAVNIQQDMSVDRVYATNINVCKTGRHKCDPNAVCKTLKSLHRCSCKKGWEGNGRTCTDVDECRLRNGGCVHMCHNSPGNYSCSCYPGF
ncbi:unnamed protein product, partial [Meganyctiphanes norvegica]